MLGLVLLAVEGFGSYVQFGAMVFAWVMGGTMAVLGPILVLAYRSWSRVGAYGITISWGLGKGRTYSWREIRWIDVRETKAQGSVAHAVRIFVEGGRRRSLPGLARSNEHPAPDFDENFRRVVDWWELSTDQAARVQPPKQFRDRLTPTVVGLVVAPVVLVVVVAAVAVADSMLAA